MAKVTTKTAKKTTAKKAITLSVKEQMEAKIAEAKATRLAKAEEAKLAKLNNVSYIAKRAELSMVNDEVNKLNEMVMAVNQIDPLIAGNGQKFQVRAFPINTLGLGLGQIAGLITGSRSAFGEIQRLEYTTITGIDSVLLTRISDAFGSPAYYSKEQNEVVEAIPYDMAEIQALLPIVLDQMEIHEFQAEDLTEEKIALYFAKAFIKATQSKAEADKAEALDGYVLDDDDTQVA